MTTALNLVADLTFVAGADLSGSQFYFVKAGSTAGQVVVCASVTDIPIGILQNTPTSGKAATVRVFGVSKVSADASLAWGDMVGTSIDGQAAAYVAGTDTTKYIVGRVIKAAGAAGRLASVFVNCLNPHRGA